ncbi:uncharacterized protein ACJ7VT_006454 [Polymixia lowei]
MLGEGFLRMLRYREERKTASATVPHTAKTHTHGVDLFHGVPVCSNSDPHTPSVEPATDKEELRPTKRLELGVKSQPVVGLSIPGCSPVPTVNPCLSLGSDTCSLLQHYPDLRLGQETGDLDDLRSTIPGHGSLTISGIPPHLGLIDPQGELTSIPDQGYLVMGASVTTSLDLPGSGLEPMSNSLLNGLLEKQLDQVYMQHLTDSLARCNSQLGNSLLHGLVPPPQPNSQLQGPDSLEAGLEGGSARERSKVISYLSTQNINPCSSHFSSPELRISEAENVHLS